MLIDAGGKVVLPSLVDPHTHLVFAGYCEDEFEMKIKGAVYLDILTEGVGILSAVRATRAAGETDLIQAGEKYFDEMLSQGTTTAEVNNGYGLTVADELKQLRAIRALQKMQPVDLVPTFLGAHAIPEDYRENSDVFVELVINEMIPAVVGSSLAEYCDIFCEEGVFNVEQSRRILQTAQRFEFKQKLHADEIVPLGGAELAVELEAISAVTINAAHAVGRAAQLGSIEVGKKADLVIFDAADYRSIAYRFGTNLVEKVINYDRLVIGGKSRN